jgi:deazaflavin-dependent oxidoreductase (nitroreductase family)
MTTRSGGIYRLMRRVNERMTLNYRKGFGPRRLVLLLTTTGRKSGLPRVTPLQYELIGGDYYLGSARGAQADWFRNLQVDPCVEIQVGDLRFSSVAEAVTDPARIADFLTLRLQRHPWMIGALMRLEGLPVFYSRGDMEKFAAGKALAIIRPEV